MSARDPAARTADTAFMSPARPGVLLPRCGCALHAGSVVIPGNGVFWSYGLETVGYLTFTNSLLGVDRSRT